MARERALEVLVRAASSRWAIAALRRVPGLRRVPELVRAASWLRDRGTGTVARGVGRGLRLRSNGGGRAYLSGDAERPVQEALTRWLRPGDVFHDVGANIGFFTVIAARLVGVAGQVLAFEPVPENAALIVANARANGLANVTVLGSAIADHNGRATLVLAHHEGGAALEQAGPPPDARGRIEVPVATLDEVVLGQGRAPPTVVKIDVEGAELSVLRGMERLLREARPIVIYEVDDAGEAALLAKYAACAAHLEAAGYRVERLADSYAGSGWWVAHGLAVPSERARGP